MNTERPENDDAAREPEKTGSETAEVRAEKAEIQEAEIQDARAEDARAEDAQAEDARAEDAQAEETGAEEEADVPGTPAGTATGPVAGTEAGAAAGSETGTPADTETGTPAGTDAGTPVGSAARPLGDAGLRAAGADAGEAAAVSGSAADEHVVGPVAGDAPPAGPRRRSPVLIASVAAAVLLVGGGGAYLTSSAVGGSGGGTGSGSPSGDGTPAALLLDDLSGGTGTPEGGTSGIAPGEPNPYGVTYQADGPLPDGPGSAPVYWAKGEVTQDEVARLAKALGAEGTPVVDGEAWKVGSGNDGSGPVLRVNRQAPGMWTFTRYAPGTDNCTAFTDKCTATPPAGSGAPVSEAAAKKAAAPVLKAVGQDGARVDASQVMGSSRVVNADPVFGGLPSYGWTTGISVDAQGEVVGGNGQLETPVKGDTYPLLSAREALDALNAAPGTDHRMGIGGCASPVPLKDRLESPCGASTTAPGTQTATVEDAVLGLAPHTSDGRQVLVPSWLFDVRAAGVAGGYTVTQPAVEPAYLKSATTPTPTPTGTPTASSGTRDVKVDGYTVEGDELVVSFTGGVCGDYKATATESGDEVKVTVTETPWKGKVCILIAEEYHQTVHLDESLGSRKVVGSDGGAIPLEKAGARLPKVR
ncbi:hypothetical protein [Streptomyces rishiriensis]|uniref:Large membrane protein n=1 Tax=Streptomyces rishiriensis TaxID=68264 RepID=A0ABU0NN24_STRRH|nr:hypothetical protein [Streptomyces rishiriensis]MDQ0580532.1 hypothetical protein [Streptomyces rishiriensis]